MVTIVSLLAVSILGFTLGLTFNDYKRLSLREKKEGLATMIFVFLVILATGVFE